MKRDDNNHVQKNREISVDIMEDMFKAAYCMDGVPDEVNIRLKNQLACQRAAGTGRFSFWWLPATVGTVISAAFSIILCLIYVLINIKGADFWMPNLLQLASETWLKLHLAALASEILISWIITFLCIWKGNLIRSAKLF